MDSNSDPEQTPLKSQETLSSWQKFSKAYDLLERSPYELGLVYLLSVMISVPFHTTVIVSPLYLTDILGFCDFQTGTIYAIYGFMLLMATVLLGGLPDRLGIANSLCISGVFSFTAMVMLAIFTDEFWVFVALLVVEPLGMAIGYPVVKVLFKKFTVDEVFSLALAFQLALEFIAYGIAAVFIELCLLLFWYSDAVFSVIFLLSAIFPFGMVMLSFIIRSSITNLERSEPDEYEPINRNTSYLEMLHYITSTKRFWRFFSITVLLWLQKSFIRHLETTLPKYMLRVIDPRAHYPLMLLLHGLIMSISFIMSTVLSYKIGKYSSIVIGGLLISASHLPFFYDSSYSTVMLYVVIISIGEGIWYPRFLEYAASVPMRGGESTFMAIAVTVMYMGMVISGLFSGYLMEEICPSANDNSECNGIWYIFTILALIPPILLEVFRNQLEQPTDEQTEEFIENSKYEKISRPEFRSEKTNNILSL